MTERHAVDVPTAARILGISTDAVRSRCQRGTLDAAKGADGQWRIHLPDGTRPEGTPDAQDVTAELVTALRDHVSTLKTENERLAHENKRLEFEFNDAKHEAATAHEDNSALIDALSAKRALPPPHNPWWRRLLGRPPDSAASTSRTRQDGRSRAALACHRCTNGIS